MIQAGNHGLQSDKCLFRSFQLNEHRKAIKERNDLIKQLTERLRSTAGEQNQLLKEEHERIRELEMELDDVKRKHSLDSSSRSPGEILLFFIP